MSIAARVEGDQRVAAACVLAARDMPAERRRAAALDRRHHLQLVEAHVPRVGFAPSGTVAAEDLRHLQLRPRHRFRRLLGRRLVLVRLLMLAAGLLEQMLENTILRLYAPLESLM